MRFRKLIPPIAIILLILLALAGTYYVRLRILEKHMAAAMDMDDKATVTRLANALPCPINARDSEGRTPLHFSVKVGDRGLVELLLAKGAGVNATFKRGWTPLHYAASKCGVDCEAVSESLVLEGATEDAWTRTCREILELLVAQGADVNAKDGEGVTALHFAACNGDVKAIEFLIQHGADVRAVTADTWTPLHYAAITGQRSVTELLIANGADVNAKDNDGWTPLWLASEYRRMDVIELLIAKGADVNARDKNGKTLLQDAIALKHHDVAELLRKAGAKE